MLAKRWATNRQPTTREAQLTVTRFSHTLIATFQSSAFSHTLLWGRRWRSRMRGRFNQHDIHACAAFSVSSDEARLIATRVAPPSSGFALDGKALQETRLEST